LSNEEKEIEKLKEQFKKDFMFRKNLQIKALDTLASYGNKGIDAVYDLMEHSTDSELKSHCLEIIKKYKDLTKTY
jgi:hypothetical protein